MRFHLKLHNFSFKDIISCYFITLNLSMLLSVVYLTWPYHLLCFDVVLKIICVCMNFSLHACVIYLV